MRKLPKQNQASEKRKNNINKKKLSLGKRKPPKHTYTHRCTHTPISAQNRLKSPRSAAVLVNTAQLPPTPNCDFSFSSRSVMHWTFQLLSDCLISIFLIAEHQEYKGVLGRLGAAGAGRAESSCATSPNRSI